MCVCVCVCVCVCGVCVCVGDVCLRERMRVRTCDLLVYVFVCVLCVVGFKDNV